jgi:hypothetical protein
VWHGRNSYKRSAKLAQFVIHRGLIISVIQAVFSSIFYFAPIALYQVNKLTTYLYNLINIQTINKLLNNFLYLIGNTNCRLFYSLYNGTSIFTRIGQRCERGYSIAVSRIIQGSNKGKKRFILLCIANKKKIRINFFTFYSY